MKGREGLWGLAAAAWFAAALGGFLALNRYQAAPGAAGETPPRWPAESRLSPAADRPTLVMLAHPQCPCTRSSIGELAWIMIRAKGRVSAFVLFLQPDGKPRAWVETDLWRAAARIPGVQALADAGGAEARRMGAETSGQTLLFDAAGRLLFSGGITGARGHPGANAGRDAVLAALLDGGTPRGTTQVFGCALASPEPAAQTARLAWRL
ncbi:MAG: RedB protein [Elusimicrobia bacterium]|nr:RedB protein [Elusimicrobiota bacterium]